MYRLIDNGTSLATDTTPWNTPYFHGSSATISTPLAIDGTNIYWMGADSAGSPKVLHPHARQGADQRRDLGAGAGW